MKGQKEPEPVKDTGLRGVQVGGGPGECGAQRLWGRGGRGGEGETSSEEVSVPGGECVTGARTWIREETGPECAHGFSFSVS